jgi:hypothetical protein
MRESVDQFGFDGNADEELWATRDYFWALKARLLDGHSAQMWRSFRAGYADQRSDSQRDLRTRYAEWDARTVRTG